MSDFATKAREIAEAALPYGYSGDDSGLTAAITAALEEAAASSLSQLRVRPQLVSPPPSATGRKHEMGYGALTAFMPWGHADETPDQCAIRKAKEWRSMPETEMQLELVDLFRRTKELLDERDRLRVAIEPFAKIKPSSLHPEDGSEAEKYAVILKGDHGNPAEFTGSDLRAARAAYEGEDNE